MSHSLDHVEGIGSAYAKKLATAGVRSTASLLKKGATAAGRKDLAKASGVSTDKLLEWVNHVDLMRIKGVGSEYSDLLEATGVDTVPELAQRNAANLHKQLQAVNNKKKIVRVLPAMTQVSRWVSQAKKLPKVVKH